MTITTPPQETRTRRRRADDDAPAPARPARRRTPPPEAGDDTTSEAVTTRSARSGAAKTAVRTRGGATTEGRVREAAPGKPPPKSRTATKTAKPAKTTTTKPVKPAPGAKATAATKASGAGRATALRRSATPPRAPFVLLVVGLLGGALVSLLLLNTVLAQDAFTLSELQRGNQQLSERKQALQEDISRENSPAVLHSKARSLGMVDGQRPAFIDARTGRVTEGGTRPPGVSDEAMAAAAAAGVAGAPGAIMPPAGGTPRAAAPRTGTPKTGTPRSGAGTAGGTR